MKKLNVGVIGSGPISVGHITCLQSDARVAVQALCDIDARTLAARGREFGVEALFTDHRRMLKETRLDAVLVCTPTFAHYQPTMDALAAGLHVFCEKPLAVDAAQAARMAAAARRARRILMVGMVMRCAPYYEMLKTFVENGFFGKIHHLRFARRARRSVPNRPWFTDPARGGGVVRDLGVHSLDLLMWAAGQWRPRRVSASLYSFFGRRGKGYVDLRVGGASKNMARYTGDDYASGMVRFDNAVTLDFEIAWAVDAPEENFYEILGDRGGMRFDLLNKENMFQFFTEQYGYLADLQPRLDVGWKDAMRPAIRFVDAALQGNPSPIPAEEAVTVMRVVDAVYASARAGREVAVRAGARAQTGARRENKGAP